jgi:nucleotide-binding universal stress UspA family protein
MKRFRRIFHPTDFSRASGAAFGVAVELAKRDRGQLVIVHVLVPPIPIITDGYISPKTFDELTAAARRDAEKRLSALVAKAKKAGAAAATLLIEGVPAEQIIRAAQRKRADLIVMGTHGRTGLPKFFMGSVAGRVIPMASCPVLTVRGR